MVDHVQDPPAYGPLLPDGVWNPVGPKAARNGHRREVGMPSVSRVFRHDPALLARFVVRRIWGVDRLLFQDSPNGCLANVDARPSQHDSDLHFAQGWTEQLDLLHSVPDEVRKSVHWCLCLDKRVIIDTSQP